MGHGLIVQLEVTDLYTNETTLKLYNGRDTRVQRRLCITMGNEKGVPKFNYKDHDINENWKYV